MWLHTPGWQEVSPDVDRLVGHLEAAEDTVQRRAPGVTVPRDDAVLPEDLRRLQMVVTVTVLSKHALRESRCHQMFYQTLQLRLDNFQLITLVKLHHCD